MDESQGPDGRRPLASNSAAATRRQAQIDDIAAGTPRLVKNSGSWFVKTYHHTRIGMAKSHNTGCPLGQPLRTRPLSVYFLQSVTSFSPIACMRYRRGRPEGVPP